MPSRQDIVWNIGDWVQSTHSVEFPYNVDGHRRIQRRLRTIHGQVVGGMYRHLGDIVATYDGSSSTFVGAERVFVYQIREGFINAPVEVLASDVKPAAVGVMRRMKTRLHESGEAYRAALSEAAKVQPRRNGKFVGERSC